MWTVSTWRTATLSPPGQLTPPLTKLTALSVLSMLNAVCFLLSSSVVCEIGPAKRAPPGDVPFKPTLSGVVKVKVNGNRQGSSEVVFTYRVSDVITAPPTCRRRKSMINKDLK